MFCFTCVDPAVYPSTGDVAGELSHLLCDLSCQWSIDTQYARSRDVAGIMNFESAAIENEDGAKAQVSKVKVCAST